MDMEEHWRYRDQINKDVEEAFKYAIQSYMRLEHMATDDARIGQAIMEELRGASYLIKRVDSRMAETNDLLRKLIEVTEAHR